MAPPNIYPRGMTLHTIGYAALKHPETAPELPIPLTNQLGVLQREPISEGSHFMTQIASQYLSALLDFQTSDDPALNDPANSQHWFSAALCLLNYLSTNPDVATRIAKHPTLLRDTVEKLLDPEIEKKMKACPRTGGDTFESCFGSLLQFVSTVLLYVDNIEDVHPNVKDLIPKLKGWKRTYRGNYIAKVSERLVPQIEGMHSTMLKMMRDNTADMLVCGQIGCGVKKGLNACGNCKVQRYCGAEHQKRDWKFHKTICNKGLVEESAGPAA